jgi:hypothetical protein
LRIDAEVGSGLGADRPDVQDRGRHHYRVGAAAPGGFTLQQRTLRAAERDEQAIDHWNPSGTAQILHKHVPAQPVGPAEAEVKLLAPYCGTGAQLGTMGEGCVGKGIALIQNLGMIKAPVDPKALVDFVAIAAASG